jgi:hypothetical protein
VFDLTLLPPFKTKRAALAGKTGNCPLYWIKMLIKLLPALQTIMLVIQVFVALLLLVRDFCQPSFLLQEPFNTKNRILKMVITVDPVGIFNQVWVIDVPPLITISDAGNIPGGMVNGSGNKLAELC